MTVSIFDDVLIGAAAYLTYSPTQVSQEAVWCIWLPILEEVPVKQQNDLEKERQNAGTIENK